MFDFFHYFKINDILLCLKVLLSFQRQNSSYKLQSAIMLWKTEKNAEDNGKLESNAIYHGKLENNTVDNVILKNNAVEDNGKLENNWIDNRIW